MLLVFWRMTGSEIAQPRLSGDAPDANLLEWAVGDIFPPRMLLGRIIGGMVKPMLLRNEEPMRRNSPTVKSLVVEDERDLRTERERLCGLIDRFAAAGPEGCTKHPHSFFGRLTPEEWATLMYKHLDHHLRKVEFNPHPSVPEGN